MQPSDLPSPTLHDARTGHDRAVSESLLVRAGDVTDALAVRVQSLPGWAVERHPDGDGLTLRHGDDVAFWRSERNGWALDYHSIEDAKTVVSTVCDLDPAASVDTDLGETLTAEQFTRRIQNDPGWDWRRA